MEPPPPPPIGRPFDGSAGLGAAAWGAAGGWLGAGLALGAEGSPDVAELKNLLRTLHDHFGADVLADTLEEVLEEQADLTESEPEGAWEKLKSAFKALATWWNTKPGEATKK